MREKLSDRNPDTLISVKSLTRKGDVARMGHHIAKHGRGDGVYTVSPEICNTASLAATITAASIRAAASIAASIAQRSHQWHTQMHSACIRRNVLVPSYTICTIYREYREHR